MLGPGKHVHMEPCGENVHPGEIGPVVVKSMTKIYLLLGLLHQQEESLSPTQPVPRPPLKTLAKSLLY